jgi:GT2 family glycosyltransferase
MKVSAKVSVKVSVIVPSYRRFQPLLNTLQDLQKQEYPDFEIIVVDQNPEWSEEYHESLAAIRQDDRILWLTQSQPEVVLARNTAVDQAKGDIVIFVDDDVEIIDSQFIHRHVTNYDDPLVHVVVGRECQVGSPNVDRSEGGGTDYLQRLSPLQQALWFDRNSSQRTEVCTFSTCNGSIRKSTFLTVGGFDESFRGNSYGDDYDLILRLHQRGFKGVYDPTAWLTHLRVPMGGLRMSDLGNRVSYRQTSTGFWLFLLRHSTPDMVWHLFYNHVLRKTVLLKVNLQRPWRQVAIVPGVALGFFQACFLLSKGPQSRFNA